MQVLKILSNVSLGFTMPHVFLAVHADPQRAKLVCFVCVYYMFISISFPTRPIFS